MTGSAPDAFRVANIAEVPLGRTGTVDDVAPLVVYLISDESSYVSVGAPTRFDPLIVGSGWAGMMALHQRGRSA